MIPSSPVLLFPRLLRSGAPVFMSINYNNVGIRFITRSKVCKNVLDSALPSASLSCF
jgi:hypothetical protein